MVARCYASFAVAVPVIPSSPPGEADTLSGRLMAPAGTTAPTPALRYWRTQRALRQHDLALRAGVNPASVHRGERGLPLRLLVIYKLAEALQVEPAELLRQPPAERHELRYVAEEPRPYDPEPPA